LLRVNAPSARALIRFLHRFGVSCGFYAPGTSFSKAISVKNLELYICPVENGCGFRPLFATVLRKVRDDDDNRMIWSICFVAAVFLFTNIFLL
jgi:hypothetical protein